MVCFPGANIEAIAESVEKLRVRGRGSILVHEGTNNAEREGTTT